jgi:hypothetical protein
VRSSEEFLQLDAKHKLGFLKNPKVGLTFWLIRDIELEKVTQSQKNFNQPRILPYKLGCPLLSPAVNYVTPHLHSEGSFCIK